MESLLDNLFINNKKKIKFGNFYHELDDYIANSKIRLNNYSYSYNSILVSVITLGIFACLKTFEGSEQQVMVKKYLEILLFFVQNTEFKAYNNFFKSFLLFISCGTNNNIPNNDREFIIYLHDNYNDYYIIQDYLKKKYRNYHYEYINQLSLLIYSFVKLVYNSNNRENDILRFLQNLYDMDKLSYDNNIYDNPNYRGFIYY